MSTISASTTSTTAYKVTADTTGTLVLQTGATPTTAVTIDTSQNVGFGNTSPAARVDAFRSTVGTYFLGGGGDNVARQLAIKSSTTTNSGDTHTFDAQSGTGVIAFATTGTERARIDSSGNFLVGATSQPGGNNSLFVSSPLNSGNAAKIGLMSIGSNTSGSGYPQIGYNFYCTGTTTLNYLNSDYASWIRFSAGKVETFTAASGTSGTATSPTTGPYVAQGGISWTNGSSDVRLKKNFEPSQGLTELLQIEPVKYHFNWDEEESPKRLGFKAQNLLPLIPEMVSEKDELAEDGTNLLTITPDYILPVLVKAIQELKAELDAAKADIATLKGAA